MGELHSAYCRRRCAGDAPAPASIPFCPRRHCKRFLAYRHESAYLLAKGKPELPTTPLSDVIPWTYSGNRLHPTQKPVECLKRIIEALSRPGDIVLDPFAGSGSTCLAAHLAGRRFFGIELDATYHAAAVNRLQQYRRAA